MVRETDLDVVMLAGRWTLLDQSGASLLAACAERDVAVVAAAPFNSGLLARDWPEADAHFDYGRPSPDVLARARSLAGICRRHGARLPAAALQFPLRHPAVTSVVVGLRTAAEVSVALRLVPSRCRRRRGRSSQVSQEHDHRAVSPRRQGMSAHG